jgi:hypothetical protein
MERTGFLAQNGFRIVFLLTMSMGTGIRVTRYQVKG